MAKKVIFLLGFINFFALDTLYVMESIILIMCQIIDKPEIVILIKKKLSNKLNQEKKKKNFLIN